MNSASNLTKADLLRKRIRDKGEVPIVTQQNGFVVTCPHCFRDCWMVSTDLGMEIAHTQERCRSWRKRCNESFTLDAGLKGYILSDGTKIGTEEFEDGG